ncbi:MAG: NUDIX hydrolase [Planctomycetes bacterium]|nr:NUDIX hydrolase [Planctomycetota bacterium]
MIEQVYQGRKFVLERQVQPLADGRVHIYEVIRHPGAAVILPVADDGRIILISNYRVAAEAELLELPAGTIDPPESPLTCARRELAEETGYRAERFEPLVSFFASPGISTERMHVFLAAGLTRGETALETGERIRTQPMKYDAALAAIRDGRIMDGKTIAALLYYDRFVRTARGVSA